MTLTLTHKILLATLFVGLFSSQSPRMQKRLKQLEKVHGTRLNKKRTTTKKRTKTKQKKQNKQNKHIYVVKETQRQKGIIISKSESTRIGKHYQEWKKEKDLLEKKAQKGSKSARLELQRRKEIQVHLIRVAKIRSLFIYGRRSDNNALMGKAKILMDKENQRFKRAMEKLADKKP